MPTVDRGELVEIELKLVVRETPDNPRAHNRIQDIAIVLDEINRCYHACAAAFVVDASLPQLMVDYQLQQLPDRPFDYKRARRALAPELYYFLRDLEFLQSDRPRLRASAPLELRRLTLGSPLQMVLEVPWIYIATTPAGFWLFVKVLPSVLGAAENVILFPKRLRRRAEEEQRDTAEARRDRIRAEREAREEEQLLSEAQRRIAEQQIEARAQQLELDSVADRGGRAPLRLRRGELLLPPISGGPPTDPASSQPPSGTP